MAKFALAHYQKKNKYQLLLIYIKSKYWGHVKVA